MEVVSTVDLSFFDYSLALVIPTVVVWDNLWAGSNQICVFLEIMEDLVRAVPEFGKKLSGKVYIQRPGVYAVICDTQQRLATVRAQRGYFLPGGGQRHGETPEMTLQREIIEECGYQVKIGREIGKAVEYISVESEAKYYQIEAAFFEAQFGEKLTTSRELDHHLVWLNISDASSRLSSQGQAWAVRQFMRCV